MADLTDVSTALVTLIAATIYPSGTGATSAAGVPCKVYAGWPTESQLDADLIAGNAHVTVFPLPTERNVTHYPANDWQAMPGNLLAREIRRQERVFQISIWANTPANRTAIAKLADPALAVTKFLTLADGFAARLIYRSSNENDMQQKAKLYRRDLFYSVEYPTTETIAATLITTVNIGISPQLAGSDVPVATITTTHI